MNINKLIQLLKSPVEEDTLIGINYMIHQYTDEEIVGFFNMYGDFKTEDVGKPSIMLSTQGFLRWNIGERMGDWTYHYTDKLGFYLGYHLALVNHPDEYMNNWKQTKL